MAEKSVSIKAIAVIFETGAFVSMDTGTQDEQSHKNEQESQNLVCDMFGVYALIDIYAPRIGGQS